MQAVPLGASVEGLQARLWALCGRIVGYWTQISLALLFVVFVALNFTLARLETMRGEGQNPFEAPKSSKPSGTEQNFTSHLGLDSTQGWKSACREVRGLGFGTSTMSFHQTDMAEQKEDSKNEWRFEGDGLDVEDTCIAQ